MLRLYLVRAWRRRPELRRPFAGSAIRLVNQGTAALVAAAAIVLVAHALLPSGWAPIATSDVLLLLTVVLLGFAWRALELVLRRKAERNEGWANVLVPSLVLSKAAVIVVGALLLIKGLFPHANLTLLWTSFGVGGVAVALALNDTLSNLFAGFYLLLDQPVRAGDLVTLNTGETGYVQHIGWRSTRLRPLNNTVIVIPNGMLAKATITNHNLPDRTAQTTLEVAVGYENDPERIQEILLAEAVASRAECPQILDSPAPAVAFAPGFRPTSINFTVIVYTSDFTASFAAAAAMRKRILRRLRQEGIAFPPPTNTVAQL